MTHNPAMRSFGLVCLAACASDPEGLRATPAGSGPVVRVDFDAEPLPDIPFPNDLATTPDPASPTGRRLNLPLNAQLRIERRSRFGLNQMTGFGLYAPIQVGFDQPIDIADLLARHPDDLHVDGHLDDDAVFLIDVDPDSPAFGEVVALDFGHGRFPQQLSRDTYLFTSDPHPGPSLLWDTVNEDRDDDGVLDSGEDTDGDGLLDVANVWPPGGDPYYDLLTSYDLASYTLYLRPVVPLREATTYAVVVTERLVGEDGEPVRSPWAWVNHTRQTPDLEPLLDLLPRYKLSVDDVAFAWTFTTGTPTADLHSVVAGLYDGQGPFRRMAADYPAGVTEAHVLHTLDDAPPTMLYAQDVIAPLTNLGLLPADAVDLMGGAYTTFTKGLVGGSFMSPNLLVDKDGDGGDGDETWAIDPATGTVVAEAQRLSFTCAIPKEVGENKGPWPISIHGHGLGSTRIEFLAFAWAMNRQGIATCAIDAPGHGLFFGEEYDTLIAALLAANRAEPLWWHLRDGRFRDLDNDGIPDPSADQFTADLLHTRDMIRQPIVDWTQLVRTLQACGNGTMEEIQLTGEGPVASGRELTTCDWDGDGEIDLGGPGTRFFFDGISMGGIEGGVATAVVPDIDAAVLTVPGGGLFDVGLRTDIGSVRDALAGRALTPLFAIRAAAEGYDLVQQVISWDRDVSYVVAHFDDLPIGGRMVVHNDDLGERAEIRIPADRITRLPMKANAADPFEKALLAGIPEGGVVEDVVYTVPDNQGLGDHLRVELFTAAGELLHTVDTFELEVVYDGVTHEVGSPLVALSWGLGLPRGSKELRQVVGVLSAGAEGADPVIYSRQWADEPVQDETREVLIALTIGDTSVPIAAGTALARSAGIVSYTEEDPRYGTSVDRYLIESEVVQADIYHGSYSDPTWGSVHYDPDDLDNGIDPYGEPTYADPVRAERPVGDGLHALRFLYVSPYGTHAYFLPDPGLAWDVNTFAAQQVASFLASGGTEVSDDPCLATPDCPFLIPIEPLP